MKTLRELIKQEVVRQLRRKEALTSQSIADLRQDLYSLMSKTQRVQSQQASAGSIANKQLHVWKEVMNHLTIAWGSLGAIEEVYSNVDSFDNPSNWQGGTNSVGG